MEVLVLDDITVIVGYQSIHLKDKSGGAILFSPGESSILRELIGTGWKMTSLPALPPQISSGSDFTIKVLDNNVFEIFHEARPHEPGFKYNFNQSHKVVEAIDIGIAKLRDLVTLKPQRVAISGEYTGGGPNDGEIVEGVV